MKLFQIRIDDKYYVTRYKLTEPGKYILHINSDSDIAGVFDEDDYIMILCCNKDLKVEMIPAGERTELEKISLGECEKGKDSMNYEEALEWV